MIAKWLILGIGVFAIVFGGYFTFAADRISGKNLLAGKKVKQVEALLNQVYELDGKLVQMKVVVSVLLLIVGIFMMGTALLSMR